MTCSRRWESDSVLVCLSLHPSIILATITHTLSQHTQLPSKRRQRVAFALPDKANQLFKKQFAALVEACKASVCFVLDVREAMHYLRSC